MRRWLESLWQDGRDAARGVRRRPGRVIAAASLLALAVGITTAMFTIVDTLVLRPVPFKDAGRLAMVDMSGDRVTPAVVQAWRSSGAFAGVEAVASENALVGFESRDATQNVARVTPGVFDLLGDVRPLRGRLFDASDAQSAGMDRVLISEDVWRTVCGSDPQIVGHSMTIDGVPAVIVGVLPAEFRFPRWNTTVWRASSFDRPGDVFTAYVRFAVGVPEPDALRRATAAAKEVGRSSNQAVARARPLVSEDDYYVRAVPLLAGGVALLFVILCANVGGLLLTGLAARGRELGTRAALGASRGRLIQHALAESSLTGVAGVVAGTGVAWALVSIAAAVLPEAALVQSLNPLDLDVRALMVTSCAGLVATLGAGLLPAVVGTRVDAPRLLQLAGHGTTEASRSRLVSRTLLVGQVALSCTLLLGASLLVRSFIRLVNEHRGLDTAGILVVDMALSMAPPGGTVPVTTAGRTVTEAAVALPGVTQVSWTYGTPPGGAADRTGTWVADTPGAAPVSLPYRFYVVDTGFFDLYRVPILRGRAFQATDDGRMMIVSERFGRAVAPGQGLVGRRITIDGSERQIIGVAGELRYPSLDRRLDTPQVYMRLPTLAGRRMLALRCDARCPDATLVRQRLLEAEPGLRIYNVDRLDKAYLREIARPRATAALAFTFAATALIAAAAGLFSLLTHSVSRRRREFGIRTALGATPGDVRRLVWREGLGLTLLGIGLGTVGGLLTTRTMTALVYEVSAADAANWAVIVSVLCVVVAAAVWQPTRAASRATPLVLMRDE